MRQRYALFRDNESAALETLDLCCLAAKIVLAECITIGAQQVFDQLEILPLIFKVMANEKARWLHVNWITLHPLT